MHRLTSVVTSRVGRVGTAVVLLALVGAIGFSAFHVKPAHAGTQQTYLVLYKQSSVAADAIANAGGTLVYSYDAIGVAIARSDNPTFAGDVSADGRVEGAASTAGFAVQLNDDQATDSSGTVDAPATPAPGSDNLSALQWDMNQIHAPEARAINGGSSSDTVGATATSLAFTHPPLPPIIPI